MAVVVRVLEASDAGLVGDVVGEELGWLNGYYARYCLEHGVCRGLKVVVDGRVAGFTLYYYVDIGVPSCVVYYLAVLEEFRGRKLGSVLLESVEEVCKAKLYLATMSAWNFASRHLFEKHCYKCFEFDVLYELIGWSRVDVLVRATCGYEDDIVCVKAGGGDNVVDVLRGVRETKSLRRVWRRVCIDPWWRFLRARVSPILAALVSLHALVCLLLQ